MSDQTPQPAPAKKPNWFVRHKILTGIGVLIILGLIFGGGANGSTDTSASTDNAAATSTNDDTAAADSTDTAVADETPTPSSKPKPAAPAAVKVQAETMLREFDDNEAAADAKYDGKTVQVTGTVAKVDTEFLDDSKYVIQLNDGKQWSVLTVNCNDVPGAVAAKAAKGSTVTVRGQFDDGGDLGVEVKDCTLVS